MSRRLALAGLLLCLVAQALAGGAAQGQGEQTPPSATLALLNRVTWGANDADVEAITRVGVERWLDGQLHPAPGDHLPPAIQAQIDALPISITPMTVLVADIEARNRAAKEITDPDQKAQARKAYQQALTDLMRQAQTRSLLRDVYSQDQLREHMTWFWFNHFNVHASKGNVRAMVGDYEDQAIRPRALGRFRDLLEATLRHPAMLRYLDNASNAAGHINENYAREIMELHTMGVGAGYSQKDVQELARILTGVGIDPRPGDPRIRPALQGQMIRRGLFEFNPNQHDYGDKVFLGHAIKGRGFAEVEEALDILTQQPATARHVSEQLAANFVADQPPPALVDRMARTFQRSNGDIAEVLKTLFRSPEFTASLGGKFKDPAHYAISAVRLTYGDQLIVNTEPIQGWMTRMAEGLYNHETPDGYPLTAPAWNGPGQMAVRFEIARQIGGGAAALFRGDGAASGEPPVVPQLRSGRVYRDIAGALAAPTRGVLDQATSPREWNAFFLSSPEFMRR